MTSILAAFLLAFVTGVLVTLAMTWVAPRLGAMDEPDGLRKIHTKPVPYLGGIGVYAGFLAPVFVLMVGLRDLASGRLLWEANGTFFLVLAGSLVTLGMGAWDDIRGLRPGAKLLLQTVAACIAMADGHLIIWRLDLPVIGVLVLGGWGVFLTLFWFLGCMNAINLLDGMDGLAGGVTLIACITLVVAGRLMGNQLGALLVACLGGGILGFLVFNFHPARIFLGDSGSNVIGYLLAALALMTSQKRNTAVALLVPVLALGVPILDTSLAVLRRWSQWLPISAPDRHHIHHILLGWGLTQRRAASIVYAASLLLCAGALLSMNGHREVACVALGALTVLIFVCVRILGAVRLTDLGRRVAQDWAARHAAGAARIEIERLLCRLSALQDLDSIWAACGPVLECLGIAHARLVVPLRGDPSLPPREWNWSAGGDPDQPSARESRGAATKGPATAPDALHGPPSQWSVSLDLPLPASSGARLELTGALRPGQPFVLHEGGMLWRLRDGLAEELQRVHASPCCAPVERPLGVAGSPVQEPLSVGRPAS